MLQELCAKNLPNLDYGALGAQLDHALRSILFDLHDRPTTKDARTLTLQIKFQPVAAKRGPGQPEQLDTVKSSYSIKTTIPQHSGTPQTFSVPDDVRKPILQFNDQSADARQGTIDDEAAKQLATEARADARALPCPTE